MALADLTFEEFNKLINLIKEKEDKISAEDIAKKAGIKVSKLNNIIYQKVKSNKSEARKLIAAFPYLRDHVPDFIFFANEEEMNAVETKVEMLEKLLKAKEDQIKQLRQIIELKEKYEKGLERFNVTLMQLVKDQGDIQDLLRGLQDD